MSITKYVGEVEVDIRYEIINKQLYFAVFDIGKCLQTDYLNIYQRAYENECHFIQNTKNRRPLFAVSEAGIKRLFKNKEQSQFYLWFEKFCDEHRPPTEPISTPKEKPSYTTSPQKVENNVLTLPLRQSSVKNYITEDIFINAYFGVQVDEELREMMRNFLITAKRINEKSAEDTMQKTAEI